MPNCSVFGCSNHSMTKMKDQRTNRPVSYHAFPVNETICQRWLDFCQRGDPLKNHWCICSRHFDTDQISHDSFKPRLVRNAVPTLNPPSQPSYKPRTFEMFCDGQPVKKKMHISEVSADWLPSPQSGSSVAHNMMAQSATGNSETFSRPSSVSELRNKTSTTKIQVTSMGLIVCKNTSEKKLDLPPSSLPVPQNKLNPSRLVESEQSKNATSLSVSPTETLQKKSGNDSSNRTKSNQVLQSLKFKSISAIGTRPTPSIGQIKKQNQIFPQKRPAPAYMAKVNTNRNLYSNMQSVDSEKKVLDENDLEQECAVDGCSSGKGLFNEFPEGLTKHTFPEDPVLKSKWISVLGRTGWRPNSTSIICSLHFKESDFQVDQTFPTNVLKPDVIPSIFEFGMNDESEIFFDVREIASDPRNLDMSHDDITNILGGQKSKIEKQLSCPVCGMKFFKEQFRQRHLSALHPERQQDNNQSKSIEEPGQGHSQSRTNHSQCSLISEEPLKMCNPTRHASINEMDQNDETFQEIDSSRETFPCPVCGLVLPREFLVKKHVQSKHPLMRPKQHLARPRPLVRVKSVMTTKHQKIKGKPKVVLLRLNSSEVDSGEYLKCPECWQMFSSEDLRQNHFLETHITKRKQTSKIIKNKNTISKIRPTEELNEEGKQKLEGKSKKELDPKIMVECPVCHLKFPTVKSWQLHYEDYHLILSAPLNDNSHFQKSSADLEDEEDDVLILS